jgi:adenylate cyclase
MHESLTLADLAVETGEPEGRLRRWHEAGLLPGAPDSFDPSSIERVRLIQFAARRGIDPEDLADLQRRQGDLLGMFVDTLGGTLGPEGHTSSVPFDEAADQAGIDHGFVERMRASAGLRDQPRAYPEDVEAMGWLALAVQAGMPEEAVMQIVRVFTDSAGRAAEAANQLFHAYVHERFRAEGKSGPELIAATQAAGEPLQGIVEPAVVYFHRKAWGRALREDFLLHLAEEVTPPMDVPGELVRTILFADLSGFTPLTEAMGDVAAAEVVDRFSEIVRDAAATHHGQVIKQIGDAFMLVFTDATSSVACGLAIDRAASAEPTFPAVRMGAHMGSVLYREADYVGATVNVAARVVGEARGHQLVVTDAVRAESRGLENVEFTFLRRERLKGLPEPVELFVAGSASTSPDRIADPVCGMEVDPERAAAQLDWQERPYLFCSTRCLQQFVADPEAYARQG